MYSMIGSGGIVSAVRVPPVIGAAEAAIDCFRTMAAMARVVVLPDSQLEVRGPSNRRFAATSCGITRSRYRDTVPLIKGPVSS